MNNYNLDTFKAYLDTKWLGNAAMYFEEVDSTNNIIRNYAETGSEEGLLVFADVQNAGRGSHGRSWSSPGGSGVWTSFLLRPESKAQNMFGLSELVALAIANTLKDIYSIDAKIKWPNDVYINNRKISGILVEMETEGNKVDFIDVGVGINVLTETFPEELRDKASSILIETGRELDRVLLLTQILKKFEGYYESLVKNGDLSEFMEEFNNLLIHKDKKIRLTRGLEKSELVKEVISEGIDSQGRLICLEDNGKRTYVTNGEVSVNL